MIREVGTQIQLATVVRDLNGTPTNAPTLVLSVTRPDATTTAPGVTNTGAGGIYTASYTIDQAGLYRYSWTASAGLVDVQSDQFSAISPQRALVASLEEFKLRLNRSDITDDVEFRSHLHSATDWAEWRLSGPLALTSYTERLRCSGYIIRQRHHQLVSVTSVTPQDGVALDPAGYITDTTNSYIELRWVAAGGPAWYTVIYSAWLGAMSEATKLAGLEVAAHLWNVQNGSAGRGNPPDDLIDTPLGFAVPRRAEEMISSHPNLMPGFA